MSTTDYADLLRTNLQGATGVWEEAVRFWEDAARRWSEPACRCGCESPRSGRQCEHGHGHEHTHKRGHEHGHEHTHERGHEREHEHEHPHGHRHDRGRGEGHPGECGARVPDCCPDVCHCWVPDADVVLHTTAGETRVVPFRLSNTWRRPREVTLAVGDWQTCQGEAVEVDARFDAGPQLTLEPCSERVVRLVVGVGGDRSEQHGTDGPERVPDVGCCTSRHTDVRFEGCSRPHRIAVVIHAASCLAVGVTCDCGCCG